MNRFLRAVVPLGLRSILLVSAGVACRRAQPASKVYRVGLLGSGSATPSAGLVDALRDGLRERGSVEGRDILLDIRFAENKSDRLPEMADDLVRSKVDPIVAVPAAAIYDKRLQLLRDAVPHVRRVEGAKPAELAVEQPTKLELVLNLKRARALDLTIPPSIVLRANDVIE